MELDLDCLFCQIIAGDIPAEIIFRNEHVVAFRDITPQAPVHLLLVPTLHLSNAHELAKLSATVLGALFTAAGEIAASHGLDGYRTVINTGASAGQSVFHVHLHLLGGRPFSWPPG